MTIAELVEKGEEIAKTESLGDFGYRYIRDYNERIEWESLTLMFLQKTFPQHPQVASFEELVNKSSNLAPDFKRLVSILKAFEAISPSVNRSIDYESMIINIFNRFLKVEQQLSRRYNSRETIRISDEYDVQDLLHSLLKLHFDDIRAEEWTPSYAGGSKRMDFLLDDNQIVIEVKKTRPSLKDKEIGEQLIVDIANYKNHSKCSQIYCFVYDKDGYVRNPRGLEKDLEKLSTSETKVKVIIRPE